MGDNLNVLALCSGIGGLEKGVNMALDGRTRTVCHVERDAFAATVLMARMETSDLERAPIWDDITTFDATTWYGVVDLITAGFPCQPWSVAGKRKGTADARWIWPEIVRIVRECEPRFVFVENVPGLRRHGLGVVLTNLAEVGFNAEWTSIRASDVGAPHRRERVFILAYRDGFKWGSNCRQADTATDGRHDARRHGAGVEHSERARREAAGDEARTGAVAQGEAQEREWRGHPAQHSGGNVGDPEGPRRPEPPRLGFPPGPGDANGWRRWLAAGGPQPAVRRDADGIPDRLDRLRCLGNAVVPQQAAFAFQILLNRIRLRVLLDKKLKKRKGGKK